MGRLEHLVAWCKAEAAAEGGLPDFDRADEAARGSDSIADVGISRVEGSKDRRGRSIECGADEKPEHSIVVHVVASLGEGERRATR